MMLTLTPKKNGEAGGTARNGAGLSANGVSSAVGYSLRVAKTAIVEDGSASLIAFIGDGQASSIAFIGDGQASSIALLGDSSASREAVIIRSNEIIRTQSLDAKENNKNHQPYGRTTTDTSKPRHGIDDHRGDDYRTLQAHTAGVWAYKGC